MANITPNSDRFDAWRFLDSVAGRSYGETRQAIDDECGRAERMVSGKGGPQARADGVVTYIGALKRILNYFHTGRPLPDASLAERKYLHGIAERGVRDGDLRPEALEPFK